MFVAPPVIETEIFARVPDVLRMSGRMTPWLEVQLRGRAVDCFLEGPSFDRDGNLYCVDIPFGRIFCISPQGEFSVAVEYDGEPNGLKIHKDGRIFVADHKYGIMVLDPAAGRIKPHLDRPGHERFRGVNDLVFSSSGDLYFTDQGQTGLQDPTGRVFRLTEDGRLDLVLGNAPSPNGLVLTPDEKTLYLAVTRTNNIWRLPLKETGPATKVGVFIQLSGGIGPDGLAVDEGGNLAIAHPGLGAVWLFSREGEPLIRIKSCEGAHPTNLAFGGPDRKTLYITEADTGTIQIVRLDVPGRVMYSHM